MVRRGKKKLLRGWVFRWPVRMLLHRSIHRKKKDHPGLEKRVNKDHSKKKDASSSNPKIKRRRVNRKLFRRVFFLKPRLYWLSRNNHGVRTGLPAAGPGSQSPTAASSPSSSTSTPSASPSSSSSTTSPSSSTPSPPASSSSSSFLPPLPPSPALPPMPAFLAPGSPSPPLPLYPPPLPPPLPLPQAPSTPPGVDSTSSLVPLDSASTTSCPSSIDSATI